MNILLMGMEETLLIIVDVLFSLFLYLNCHTDLKKTQVGHSDTPARDGRGGIKMSW